MNLNDLSMDRRALLAALPAALLLPTGSIAAPRTPTARTADYVRRLAKKLSEKPYVAPEAPLPPELAELDYDGYRKLHFRQEMAIWRDLPVPFQLQMFPRGGLATRPVEIHEVVDGRIRPIVYDPEYFSFDHLGTAVKRPDVGFAGFRIHNPINRADLFEEFAVFLGASYFRAVHRHGTYGLSARAIEIGAGEYQEEFPGFRAFYIERPSPGAASIVVHALLDGPSVAGAYTFRIAPGDATTFDVEGVLYPRRALEKAGLAPLTSMFLFGSASGGPYEDFRPAVHDTDGLLIARADGARDWRALANPPEHRISRFEEAQATGYGLTQRQQTFDAYQDLEALYHRRPGAWVEPRGSWGAGAVQLAELHARSEGEDNTVVSWRPAAPLPAHQPFSYAYRLAFAASPEPATPLARVASWRVGRGDTKPWRRILVEFTPVDVASLDDITADVAVDSGPVRHVTLQPNPNTGGVRLAFEFQPKDGEAQDTLRASLRRGGALISETWRAHWPA